MRKIKIFILLFIALIGIAEFAQVFFINLTASIPTGIYVRTFGPIEKGDIVVYKPNKLSIDIGIENGYVKSPNELFIKYVGLIGSGQYIISESREFLVDGALMGKCHELDRFGNIMPFKPGEYQIAENEFLPVGSADRSFDGRYTGPVSRENIVCKAVPLILFDVP